MKNLITSVGLMVLFLIGGLSAPAQNAYAASAWAPVADWFKSKPAKGGKPESTTQPSPAPAETHPAATETTPEAKPLQPAEIALSEPRWTLETFPSAAIAQQNYAPIRLSDYVSSPLSHDHFLFSFTPGKENPSWAKLQPDGQLIILTDKINPEDVDTTQIIYLTAISGRSGRSTPAQITIKITPNILLPAPRWQSQFTLPDAIPGKPYTVNLSHAININDLREDDQLIFQLISVSANWLQIGENGFSLVSKKTPEDAAGRSYDVTLRVTSKMSQKSNDFNGKLLVNEIPKPFQWLPVSNATLNVPYTLDLAHSVTSNIKNDRFSFHVDLATLPSWLSVENQRFLRGTPQNADLAGGYQKIHLTAASLVSGMTSETTLYFTVNSNPRLTPVWKKDFLSSPIINEPYRSEDLTTALENRYPHDALHFEMLGGPDWMEYNELCHCLISKGDVPDSAAGQSYMIKLRAHSQAGGKSADYEQSVKAYSGMPQWTKTVLPDIQIGQTENLEVPLDNYAQDDISGDQFTYSIDPYHSPQWVSVGFQNGKPALIIHSKAITANEVNTAQTVRLIATSRSTHKTSAQLLIINVKPNLNLPRPVWKGSLALPVATVGVSHAADLSPYITTPLTNDHLTIRLGAPSPSWLSVENNKLTGSPPRDAIGGPYPVTLLIHSQASNSDTVIRTKISAQLAIVLGDNMETHSFLDNHQSIVVRGLQKNHAYHLFEVKGRHLDYGPFYSPYPIKTEEDWNGNPFYAVGSSRVVKTGDDGIVSIVYYSNPSNPPPQFELVILR